MLSTQTSNLPPGQHRRQKSTPTVFDTLKVPLPPATKPRYGSHGRSLSLDQPTNIQQQQTLSPQDGRTVSIKRHEQQYLRETQQHQQKLVRPGQKQQQQTDKDQSLRDTQLESYPEYDSGSSSHFCFSHQRLPSLNDRNQADLRNYDETEDLNDIKSIDSNMFAGYLDGFEYESFDKVLDIDFKGKVTIESTPNDENTPDKDVTPRPDRERPPRPCTPQGQSDICYFPITPTTTPFSKTEKSRYSAGTRTAASSPTRRNRNLTIKASHPMKRGSSCQDAFNTSKLSPGTCKLPSPAQSAHQSYSNSATFPPLEFLDMSTMTAKMDCSSISIDYASSQCSPVSNGFTSAISSFQSSPEIKHLSLLSDPNDALLGPNPGPPFSLEVSETDAAACAPKEFSHSKAHSESECDRDTSIEDTGITSEEITAFMYGPGPDNRWACTFPGCNRTFGRKENIKSHIQNHLGDRQFICSVCGNDFVRQHDLKRHMKIHSGVKPYNCPCGRTFCRQDALTRHRQRNTCEGGFEGLLKSPTKRGRPKKTRPETDKRLAKSAKTRHRALQKANEKAYEKSYQSSTSCSSVCSFPSPPHVPDDAEICGNSPFDDAESLHANLTEFLSSTPPSSPGYSTGNSFSSQNSQLSSTAKGVSMSPSPRIMSIPEESQVSDAMSRESSTSYYGTPPELEISCSSPSVPHLLDFNGGSEATSGAHTITSLPQPSSDIDLLNSDHDIDQMFMDSLDGVSLDKDPVFLLQNFENPFPSGSPWQDGFEGNLDNFFDNL